MSAAEISKKWTMPVRNWGMAYAQFAIYFKDLPVKKDSQAYTNTKGTSISERLKEIDARDEIGHWEMDTVVGKQGTKTVLLVLSERATREELIFKIPSKSQSAVVKQLDKLERKIGKSFAETFKTITCDNGCGNLDFEGIETSVRNKDQSLLCSSIQCMGARHE